MWLTRIGITGVTVVDLGTIALVVNASPLKDIVTTCSACHGSTGNSSDPQYPKLAGQNASYLAAQLHDFKNGTRKSNAMSAMASALSNQDIQQIARFFSQQPIEPDPIKDVRLATRGKSIFYSGARPVPSCALCHASKGSGGMMGTMHNMGIVPIINGQHATYDIAS